jgi:F0F1-type ATP synthase delta subunit
MVLKKLIFGLLVSSCLPPLFQPTQPFFPPSHSELHPRGRPEWADGNDKVAMHTVPSEFSLDGVTVAQEAIHAQLSTDSAEAIVAEGRVQIPIDTPTLTVDVAPVLKQPVPNPSHTLCILHHHLYPVLLFLFLSVLLLPIIIYNLPTGILHKLLERLVIQQLDHFHRYVSECYAHSLHIAHFYSLNPTSSAVREVVYAASIWFLLTVILPLKCRIDRGLSSTTLFCRHDGVIRSQSHTLEAQGYKILVQAFRQHLFVYLVSRLGLLLQKHGRTLEGHGKTLIELGAASIEQAGKVKGLQSLVDQHVDRLRDNDLKLMSLDLTVQGHSTSIDQHSSLLERNQDSLDAHVRAITELTDNATEDREQAAEHRERTGQQSEVMVNHAIRIGALEEWPEYITNTVDEGRTAILQLESRQDSVLERFTSIEDDHAKIMGKLLEVLAKQERNDQHRQALSAYLRQFVPQNMLLNESYQPMLSQVPEGDIYGLVLAWMKVMTARIQATSTSVSRINKQTLYQAPDASPVTRANPTFFPFHSWTTPITPDTPAPAGPTPTTSFPITPMPAPAEKPYRSSFFVPPHLRKS